MYTQNNYEGSESSTNLPLAIGLILFALFVAAFVGIKLLRIPDIVIFILLGAALSFTDYFGDTDKRESLESGLALTPRGEFSVIIAGLATGVVQIRDVHTDCCIARHGLFQMASEIGDKLMSAKKEK